MSSRREWIKKFFVDGWRLKLPAFFLAALSYYAIRSAISFEVSYEVPLEVEVDKGIAILDKDTRQIEVTFRGSQVDLRKLDQNRIKAVLHPRGSDASGSERITVSPRNIQGVTDVRVVKIRPGIVTVFFDHEAEKEVPIVKPKTVGRPLLGKAEVEYEPRFVTIRGPRRRLTDQHIMLTEPVDVDGRVESFEKRVRVLAPGDAWLSAIEPSEITVRVSIVTESVSREFSDVPVLVAMPPGTVGEVFVDPDRVQVSLHGRAEAVEKLAPESLKVFVDLTGLDSSTDYELPLNVHLPAGMDVSAVIIPPTVKAAFKSN